ncbi:carbohydrate ABC transporter permease [Saccharibacillus brassicae]|nr:sugar ABC transporter permease [Saccharibacillus brassicae]
MTLREKRLRRIALYFIIPASLFFVAMNAYPLLTVIRDSFYFNNMLNASMQGFAGLQNYASVLQNENFQAALRNTVVWTLLSVAGEYVLGLISALALNQNIRFRAVFRGIVIIPWVVPIVVAGMTWSWMLDPDFGIINYLLVKVGLLEQSYYWLGEMDTALLTVIFVNIWRSFPFFTISLLAGLQSVSRDTLEAAAIDGAGVRRRFFSIVLPQLKTVSVTIVFVHLIWTAINFDFIWVMTEGGPLYATETLPIQIYRYAMQDYNFGQASALASMMLGFMMIVFLINFMNTSRKTKR